jgi:hypothetical protein
VQVVGEHLRVLAVPRYIYDGFAVYGFTVNRDASSGRDRTNYVTAVLKEQGESWMVCAVRSNHTILFRRASMALDLVFCLAIGGRLPGHIPRRVLAAASKSCSMVDYVARTRASRFTGCGARLLPFERALYPGASSDPACVGIADTDGAFSGLHDGRDPRGLGRSGIHSKRRWFARLSFRMRTRRDFRENFLRVFSGTLCCPVVRLDDSPVLSRVFTDMNGSGVSVACDEAEGDQNGERQANRGTIKHGC